MKLDYKSNAGKDSDGQPRPQYLDIPIGRSRRWKGLVAYLLLFVSVSAALVALFMKFTTSLWLAIGVVAFMVGYMAVMGWLASRNIESHDQ